MQFRLLLVVVFMMSCNLYAQHKFYSTDEPRPVLKLNILSPVIGVISLQYEKPIDRHSSHQYGLFIFTGQTFGSTIPLGGIGLTYDYRFYLTSENQTGFYVQPYGRYQYFYFTNSVTRARSGTPTIRKEDQINVYGGGLVLGRQWVFFKKLTLDIYLGPMFNTNSNSMRINPKNFSPFFYGFYYRSGVTLGFRFK